MKAYFDGSYPTFCSMPQPIRDGLWDRFLDKYVWPTSNTANVYDAWKKTTKDRYKDMMNDARNQGKCKIQSDSPVDWRGHGPPWIRAEHWDSLLIFQIYQCPATNCLSSISTGVSSSSVTQTTHCHPHSKPTRQTNAGEPTHFSLLIFQRWRTHRHPHGEPTSENPPILQLLKFKAEMGGNLGHKWGKEKWGCGMGAVSLGMREIGRVRDLGEEGGMG
ncbi:Uncharacterized protein Fot_21987 [Forsythia ovata]|uniref:Uncharacterized protein n=1 Tax=Forsythia ovata TaxID=205694 RepID=A0ABD1UWS7_9LAMI